MAEGIAELKTAFDDLNGHIEKQELRVRYHETRVYHVAMAYLIPERLLIAFATSNSSLNYCLHWWMLLGFNLASTCLYISFFLEAVTMTFRAQNHLDTAFQTLHQISQRIIILNNLTNPDHARHLEAGDSVSRVSFGFRVQELEYRPYRILHRKLYFASILLPLLALTAFQLCVTFSYSPCN